MTVKIKGMSVLEIAWKQYLIDNVSESSRANTTNKKLADNYRKKFTSLRLSGLKLTLDSKEYIEAYVLVEELCKKEISPLAFLAEAKSKLYAS